MIKGNHDQKVAETPGLTSKEFMALPQEKVMASASLLYTAYTINDEDRNYLLELPESIVMNFDGISIRFVHGSPRGIAEYMYEDKALLMRLGNTFDEDVIVSGHTHLPYHKEIKNKHFINAGSVGKPKHGNANALYAVIEVKDRQMSTEFIEVAYDVTAMEQAILDNQYIPNKLIELLKKRVNKSVYDHIR